MEPALPDIKIHWKASNMNTECSWHNGFQDSDYQAMKVSDPWDIINKKESLKVVPAHCQCTGRVNWGRTLRTSWVEEMQLSPGKPKQQEFTGPSIKEEEAAQRENFCKKSQIFNNIEHAFEEAQERTTQKD